MSFVTPSNVRRAAASGVAAAVLVGGAATGAQAAASYPHVTLAKAKLALPTSKSLPGGVTLVGKVHSAGKTFAAPCVTKPANVPLAGGSVVIADYGNHTDILSPKYLSYEVSTVVFATATQAEAAAAKVAKADKGCPKTAKRTVEGVPETISRTLLTKATSKAWTGYRTIDHITVTNGTTTFAIRGYETFLTRGNVLVIVDEIAAITATNGAQSDARRKTATNLVIQRLSAIK
jgi:hypothetical protein